MHSSLQRKQTQWSMSTSKVLGIVGHQGKTDQKPHEGTQVHRLQPSHWVRLLELRSLRQAKTTQRPCLKTRSLRFSFTRIKIVVTESEKETTSVREDAHSVGGNVKFQLLWKTVWQFLKRLNIFHWVNYTIQQLYSRHLPKGKARPDICAQIHTAALCLTVKIYKQPKYLLTDGFVNWYGKRWKHGGEMAQLVKMLVCS